jgi:hypothetical protein
MIATAHPEGIVSGLSPWGRAHRKPPGPSDGEEVAGPR